MSGAIQTKQSNENAYASATGEMTGCASSYYYGTAITRDEGHSIAEMNTTAIGYASTPAASQVSTEIAADSLAQRNTGNSNDKLAAGSAYIDSGAFNVIYRTGSTASVTPTGTTDSLDNGWGFKAGSQLSNGAAGTSISGGPYQVYAGMDFTAQGQLVTGTNPSPSLKTELETASILPYQGGEVADIQGAKFTGSYSSLDTVGTLGTIRNFDLKAADSTNLGANTYETSWNN